MFWGKPVGRQTADSRPTDGQQSADRRPTVGQQTADSRPTDDRQSADRFFGELFFTITQIQVAVELLCHNVCFLTTKQSVSHHFFRICGGYLPNISCCPGEKPAGGCYTRIEWHESPTYEYNVGKASKGWGHNKKDRKERKDSQRCAPNNTW